MVEDRKQKYILAAFAYVIMGLLALMCVIPLIIVISASFSSENLVTTQGYGILPKGLTLNAYKIVFANSETLINSYIVTIITTVVGTLASVLVTSMAAYPLSRRDYKFKNKINFYFYFTMLFSGGAIPSYLINTTYLHLDNTIWVLILPLLFSPWNAFVLRTYFAAIPKEMIESAKIDGANEFTTFFKIVFPMAKTGVITIGMLVALGYWNNWYNCLMYMTSDKYITLQYFLQRTMSNINAMLKNAGSVSVDYSSMPTETAMMAMCVLAVGPMLFVFMYFQKYFSKGMNMGSVKG